MSIKVVTTTGVTYDGELFAVDTVSRSLSLKTTSGAYVILNPAGIQSITGNFSGSKPSDLSKLGLRWVHPPFLSPRNNSDFSSLVSNS